LKGVFLEKKKDPFPSGAPEKKDTFPSGAPLLGLSAKCLSAVVLDNQDNALRPNTTPMGGGVGTPPSQPKSVKLTKS